MKRFFVALFAIGVLFSACSKKSDGEKIDVSVIDNMTTIKFERDVIDFKNVEEGEKVSGSFKFTNTGSGHLPPVPFRALHKGGYKKRHPRGCLFYYNYSAVDFALTVWHSLTSIHISANAETKSDLCVK